MARPRVCLAPADQKKLHSSSAQERILGIRAIAGDHYPRRIAIEHLRLRLRDRAEAVRSEAVDVLAELGADDPLTLTLSFAQLLNVGPFRTGGTEYGERLGRYFRGLFQRGSSGLQRAKESRLFDPLTVLDLPNFSGRLDVFLSRAMDGGPFRTAEVRDLVRSAVMISVFSPASAGRYLDAEIMPDLFEQNTTGALRRLLGAGGAVSVAAAVALKNAAIGPTPMDPAMERILTASHHAGHFSRCFKYFYFCFNRLLEEAYLQDPALLFLDPNVSLGELNHSLAQEFLRTGFALRILLETPDRLGFRPYAALWQGVLVRKAKVLGQVLMEKMLMLDEEPADPFEYRSQNVFLALIANKFDELMSGVLAQLESGETDQELKALEQLYLLSHTYLYGAINPLNEKLAQIFRTWSSRLFLVLRKLTKEHNPEISSRAFYHLCICFDDSDPLFTVVLKDALLEACRNNAVPTPWTFLLVMGKLIGIAHSTKDLPLARELQAMAAKAGETLARLGPWDGPLTVEQQLESLKIYIKPLGFA